MLRQYAGFFCMFEIPYYKVVSIKILLANISLLSRRQNARRKMIIRN